MFDKCSLSHSGGGVIVRKNVAAYAALLVSAVLLILVTHQRPSLTRPPAIRGRNTKRSFNRDDIIVMLEKMDIKNQSIVERLAIIKTLRKMEKMISNVTKTKQLVGIPIQLPQVVPKEHTQQTFVHKDGHVASPPVQVIGELKPFAKYAVFGCMYPRRHDANYAFYMPLTARAWQRTGFESIAVLTGTYEKWQNSSLTKCVVDTLRKHAVIVFLDTAQPYSMLISQISRIFMACVLDWKDHENYLLSTDVDLWPLAEAPYYQLYPEKHILSLNSMCCGEFPHRGGNIRMLPMVNIGMNVTTWRRVLRQPPSRNNVTFHNGSSPSDQCTVATASDMVHYAKQEFGDLVDKPYGKGAPGWYLDQKLISVRIDEFMHRHGRSYVQLVLRQTFMDRIDRGRWLVPDSLSGIVDAHLPYEGFKDKPWETIVPLLHLMYPEDIVNELQTYRTTFYDLYRRLYH